MNKNIVTGICLCLLAYACGQTLYVPSPEMLHYDSLITGRKLYVDHCSSCHNLHFPEELTKDQWKMQLDEMQEKAKISDSEKDIIFQYLTSRSK